MTRRRATLDAAVAIADAADDRLMTIAQILDLTTLTRSTWWKYARLDPDLRRARVQLAPTRVAWRASAVKAWLAKRSTVAQEGR